jgi:hypothetical protein
MWKNTAASAWKQATKVQIKNESDSIATRMRFKSLNVTDHQDNDMVEYNNINAT